MCASIRVIAGRVFAGLAAAGVAGGPVLPRPTLAAGEISHRAPLTVAQAELDHARDILLERARSVLEQGLTGLRDDANRLYFDSDPLGPPQAAMTPSPSRVYFDPALLGPPQAISTAVEEPEPSSTATAPEPARPELPPETARGTLAEPPPPATPPPSFAPKTEPPKRQQTRPQSTTKRRPDKHVKRTAAIHVKGRRTAAAMRARSGFKLANVTSRAPQADGRPAGVANTCSAGTGCVSPEQIVGIIVGIVVGGILGGPGGAVAGAAIGAILTAPAHDPGLQDRRYDLASVRTSVPDSNLRTSRRRRDPYRPAPSRDVAPLEMPSTRRVAATNPAP